MAGVIAVTVTGLTTLATYELQASTDLDDWTTISTLTPLSPMPVLRPKVEREFFRLKITPH